MDPMVTAIYHSPAVAHLVGDVLERLGIACDRISVLPGARIVPPADEASGSQITQGNLEDALHRLQDLHLSEDDTRICGQALRSGGFVVSVSLEDGSDLDWVRQVMDRPDESYDLNELDAPCLGETAVPTASRWAAMPVSGL